MKLVVWNTFSIGYVGEWKQLESFTGMYSIWLAEDRIQWLALCAC
jgi:hypothetical protein